MNYNDIWSLINRYDSIVIFRHKRPDLDALGSQIGLSQAISKNFNNKEVYIVGDMSQRYSFIGKMDDVSDDIISSSLAIICDVSVAEMVSDERYKQAKEVLVIDHHKNECNIPNASVYSDTTKVACAEIISDMLLNLNLEITAYGATALYGGIVTDSGRFQYPNTTKTTFLAASYLLSFGADIDFIYEHLYVETLEQRLMKNYFSSLFQITEEGVAYLKSTKEVLAKYLMIVKMIK